MLTGIASEEFRAVDCYLNYEVSNIGRVRNSYSGKILKQYLGKDNIYRIKLYKNGRKKIHKIHEMVAREFVENPNNKKVVEHLDKNTRNSCINNLFWTTKEEQKYRQNKLKNPASKYIGVGYIPNIDKWYAFIFYGEGRVFLGKYDTEEQAARNYNIHAT